MINGLAYHGISLATGGIDGAIFRAEQREKKRDAERKAALDALNGDTRLAPCDRYDLWRMVLTEELYPPRR